MSFVQSLKIRWNTLLLTLGITMNKQRHAWDIPRAKFTLVFQAAESVTGKSASCAFAFPKDSTWAAKYAAALAAHANFPDILLDGLPVEFAAPPDAAYVAVSNGAPPDTPYDREITVTLIQNGAPVGTPYHASIVPGQETWVFELQIFDVP